MSETDREPNDDYFGLAVLIFLLLMEGNHPYDPVDSSGPVSSGNTRLENIKREPLSIHCNTEQACNCVAENKRDTRCCVAE